MRNVHRPIVERAVAILIAFDSLVCRYAIPLIMTGFDGSTVIGFGQTTYEFLTAIPFGRAVLALLVTGLFGSLTHIWLLTIRNQPTS